ncbi:MAG TPA: sulfite exporter TauE/SafE family protein [Acidobacteriaceae bacterium]|nr:sulfite exporter TauE/SafE family protein [Acidobacteriaceae bacterium]
MELAIGFVIAFAIAVTGVGAGTITAPLLILFLHVPIELSVGTALAYSAIVKMIVVPVQIWRKQVVYRVVGWMLLGGLPGVVFGVVLFHRVVRHGRQDILYVALGSIIVVSSAWHLYRNLRPPTASRSRNTHPAWIAALMLPIGTEVGFSSSGAGALGTLALMSLTTLEASQVVGTDLVFGLGLSLVGGGMHVFSGSYDGGLLLKLVIGGLFGALAGSAVAPRLPNRQLRVALAALLLVVGTLFCVRPLNFHPIASLQAVVHASASAPGGLDR